MISANGGLPAHRYTLQVTQRWPQGSEPASPLPASNDYKMNFRRTISFSRNLYNLSNKILRASSNNSSLQCNSSLYHSILTHNHLRAIRHNRLRAITHNHTFRRSNHLHNHRLSIHR